MQEVTKILNWPTDWTVIIEGEQRESKEVGKSGAKGGTKENRGAAADGNGTTLLYSEMLFQLKPLRICLSVCLSLSPCLSAC